MSGGIFGAVAEVADVEAALATYQS
jgi:hypothetical protein